MSLRALLNDEPQDPITSLPSRRNNSDSNSRNQSKISSGPFSPTPSVNGPSKISNQVPNGYLSASPSRAANGLSHPVGMDVDGEHSTTHAEKEKIEFPSEEPRTGSTGRSNLTRRTSPSFTRPRAYSSDLEEHPQIWTEALGRYILKTRARAKDIEKVFKDHNQQSVSTFSSNLKSNIAERLVRIQSAAMVRAQQAAKARPYSNLIVGASSPENSAAGSEEDELRGDDPFDGVHSYHPTGFGRPDGLHPYSGRGHGRDGWDGASTAPSADEGDPLGLSGGGRKRDGRRRKAFDADADDMDSIMGDGSTTGTPKRGSKKRKVDPLLAASRTGPTAAASGGTVGLIAPKPAASVGGRGGRGGAAGAGGKRGSRKSGRIGSTANLAGKISIREWNVPFPELGPPPIPPITNEAQLFIPHSLSKAALDLSQPATLTSISEERYDTAFKPIWADIVTNGIPYAHKSRANHVAATHIVHERVGKWCASAAKRGWGGDATTRKSAVAGAGSKQNVKMDEGGRFGRDAFSKSKKLQRELLTFWKKNEKEEREERRRREKERVEKARMEMEKKEEMRQRRKLEFLITQTELYSHFVGKRLKTSQLEAEDPEGGVAGDPALVEEGHDAFDLEADMDENLPEGDDGTLDFDKDDPARLQALARRQARQRMLDIRQRAEQFDQARREANAAAALLEMEGGNAVPPGAGGDRLGQMDMDELNKETGLKDLDSDELNFQNPTMLQNREMIPQPEMLQATLKEYQLKGLNWLSGLYEQGINGILADEMGLGKTIQSISLLGHLAERHDIWGPFLIVSPASTLHNWQQELTRFVPSLKVVPYWGTVADRKTLRKFWAKKAIVYDRDAPFHIIVTSYNLIVTDSVYLKSLKWQYMILDEAQAIKSSSSARWNILLDFHCRNRLLLTGTPIQNSMQELWALLHFIMPSLFDSHDEFSEWFSKDIEGAAGSNGGGFNEHQLRRLHMILKPFMLRRVKRHVQNELGEKIEIDLYCELTPRQRYLYKALRANSSVAELLRQAANFATDAAATASLMNLVMQFRKVCNHPELFERADVQAPFSFATFGRGGNIMREGDSVEVPYSTRNPILYSIPSLFYFEGGLLDVPSWESSYGSYRRWTDCSMNIWQPDWMHQHRANTFGFLSLLNQTPSDVNRTYRASVIERMLQSAEDRKTIRDDGPLFSDSDFAAHYWPHSDYLIVPKVTHFLNRAEGLPRLSEISLEAWNDTPLSRRQTQIYVEHAAAPSIDVECRSTAYTERFNHRQDAPLEHLAVYGLPPWSRENPVHARRFLNALPFVPLGGLVSSSPSVQLPSAQMHVPEPKRLIFDSGKLAMLDNLLMDLKPKGHRCLIYFQMTKMIDLMEEYMIFRQYKYLRLDGDTRLEDRRDMVMDWQQRDDIFCFLLSTRAGGLGINLTAADTVIFYECDWNPSNDAQAMDRAHRLGQTRQVTVYRLITKGTIDQRIVQMAGVKKDVQDIVVGNKPFVESHKPHEIVKLLLDDEELEALQARGDSVALPPSGIATPSGVRKPAVQVHGSWEAEDDGFFTAGPSNQPAQDEDIEFGGAPPGSGINTPGGIGANTPGGYGTGGELVGPRGGKIRVRGRGRGRGRPPGIPNGEGKTRRPRGGGTGTKRGRGRGKMEAMM